MAAGKREKLEFGGVPGNFLIMLGLPVLTAYLFFAVRFNDGALLPGPAADVDGFFSALVQAEMCYNFVLAYPNGALTNGMGITGSTNHCLQ